MLVRVTSFCLLLLFPILKLAFFSIEGSLALFWVPCGSWTQGGVPGGPFTLPAPPPKDLRRMKDCLDCPVKLPLVVRPMKLFFLFKPPKWDG